MDTQLQTVGDDAKDDNTTNHKIEEIYIKQEPLDTISENCELYENVLLSVKKEEYISDNDEQSEKEYENPFTENNDTHRKTENAHSNSFCCDICNKSFRRKDHWQIHLKIHNAKKEYKCLVCKKLFTQSTYLKRHMKRHPTEHNDIQKLETSFCCSECNKIFTRKDSLKRHVKIHSGMKKYECWECKKLFAYKDYVKLHTGAKNFRCPTCNKSFSRSVALHNNMKKRLDKILNSKNM